MPGRWRLPGAAGVFEGFGDGENQFVFEGTADDLHADGKTFLRKADGDGSARETSEIEPLGKTHGVAIAGAGVVASFAVAEGGRGRNGRQKDGDIVHLAEDFLAEKVALGAGLDELIEREWIARGGDGKIFAQHGAQLGAELGFVVSEIRVEQTGDYRAEEKPPEFESAIEPNEFDWFNKEGA